MLSYVSTRFFVLIFERLSSNLKIFAEAASKNFVSDKSSILILFFFFFYLNQKLCTKIIETLGLPVMATAVHPKFNSADYCNC